MGRGKRNFASLAGLVASAAAVLILGIIVILLAGVLWDDPDADAWGSLGFYGILLAPAVLFLRFSVLNCFER